MLGWQGPEYDGLGASLAFLQDQLRTHHPVVGLVGFSQGAAMVAALLDHLQASQVKSALRWCVLLSGVSSPGLAGKEPGRRLPGEGKEKELLELPSLHIYDPQEEFAAQCSALTFEFAAAHRRHHQSQKQNGASIVIKQHSDGHSIPLDSEFHRTTSNFIAKHQQ